MRFLSSDLLRNFGIGFVIGTVLVVGANAESWSGDLAPAARAAESAQGPASGLAPAAEFVIAPEGR
jgi:hypothetical protein